MNRRHLGAALAIAVLTTGLMDVAPAFSGDRSYSPTLQPDKGFEKLQDELQSWLKSVDRFILHNPYQGYRSIEWRTVRSLRVDSEGVLINFAGNAEVYGTGNPVDLSLYFFRYEDLAAVRFDVETCWPHDAPLPDGMNVQLSQPVGYQLCDTLFNLAQHGRSKQAAAEARFAEEAERYRSLATKPPVTEDLRRLIVQAETRRESKNYNGAVERYHAVIKLSPTAYPAAYFNLALLYEQMKQY